MQEVAIRCEQEAYKLFQNYLPPKKSYIVPDHIYKSGNSYILYWESINWDEYDTKHSPFYEGIRKFNHIMDLLEQGKQFFEKGKVLPGYGFEFLCIDKDFCDIFRSRTNLCRLELSVGLKINLPENMEEISAKPVDKNWLLKITYSWGDEEPGQEFVSKEDAWNKALSMAMVEADTASDEGRGPVQININKEEFEIILVYQGDMSECKYQVLMFLGL